jgi:hypothetical protein
MEPEHIFLERMRNVPAIAPRDRHVLDLPELRDQQRLEEIQIRDAHRAWLASMTPEQKAAKERQRALWEQWEIQQIRNMYGNDEAGQESLRCHLERREQARLDDIEWNRQRRAALGVTRP